MLADLSLKLTKRYGDGFSETTLQYFRKFYLAYAKRHFPIPRPLGVKLAVPEKGRTAGDLFVGDVRSPIQDPMGIKSFGGFSPQLNWSHYRALMRLEKPEAHDFYEAVGRRELPLPQRRHLRSEGGEVIRLSLIHI